MAATCPEQDSSRDGRKHPLRGETKEMELDRSHSKKGFKVDCAVALGWNVGENVPKRKRTQETPERRRKRGRPKTTL